MEYYTKIEKYLKKNFPKHTDFSKVKKIGKGTVEVFGFGGLQILVIETPDQIIYQVVKFTDDK